eukprot:gnl/TRDRNA2_/TRDRNA2_176316_c1_seq6.p1 gnl/TRDRNA2_/TRDRNA2_176316_c1~~gnl/TRDRNA2_/TRDRNA2_176316_c1_seq6.p1  ORF type:complete len:674 (+),score=161.54 gnl/TRDRNA2_/TRDRNA2_176316_c1_seq6:51-2024(+)
MATEQKAYDKYACWCENVSKEKAAAIVQAKQEVRQSGQEILKLKALANSQGAELEETKHIKIKQSQKVQAAATALRSKENADYMSSVAEIQQSLKALEEALALLKESTAVSLLQRGSSALREKARAAIGKVVLALPTSTDVSNENLALLNEFVQTEQTSFAKYAPQSATIQGILQDMYQNFARMLESITQTEARRNTEFEALMHTEHRSMADLQKQAAKTGGKKSEALLSLAEATETYDDTLAQVEADIKFFDAMKESCQNKSAEWTTRKKQRVDEIAGVKLALKILLHPPTRKGLHKSSKRFRTGKWHGDNFLQVSSSRSETDEAEHRRLAYVSLKSQATKVHSIRLAQLAATVYDGRFADVTKKIDDMISLLKEEEASDVEKKDWCKEEYQEYASTTNKLKFDIAQSEAHIDKLESKIDMRRQEKLATISEIDKMMEDVSKMQMERAEEHAAFLDEQKWDKFAIKVFDQAKEALGKYYHEQGLSEEIKLVKERNYARFIQEPVFEISKEQAPEATFKDKGSRVHQAQGIIGLMTILQDDMRVELKTGAENEAKAQTKFEEELADARSVLEKLFAKKTELMQIISRRAAEKTDLKILKESRNGDLRAQDTEMATIKEDCDWILSAFDKRKEARALEMDGLNTAQSYLSGGRGLGFD